MNALPLNELQPDAIATGKTEADLNLERPIIWLEEHTELLEVTWFEEILKTPK